MNAPVDRRLPAKRAKAALASLELATAMGRSTVAKSIEPKPLYVRRDLLNAADLVAWAKRVGIPNVVAASEMHVTVCYSRAPVDWMAIGNDYRDTVIVGKGGPRALARFGKTDAKVAVLAFASSDLEWRHREMVERGASFDFTTYRPHVTIGLNLPPDFDLDAVEPYQGALRFGPEVFQEIDDDFTVRMAKAGWSSQARVPSGPKGGQWTSSGYGGGMAGLGPKGPAGGPLAAPSTPKLNLPWLGQDDVATHRFKGDPQQAAFMKPMKESEMTGQPAWLGNDEGIVLKNPQKPTSPENNDNPDDRATFVAGHSPGEGLNGVPFKPWDGPEGGDWAKVDGTGDFDEPDLPATKGKRLGAGVVITEPDGRVWTLTPTNHFGGYFETLPKGGIEPGLNLRQTAIKEAWEESGLKVRLTGYIGDFERNTSVARYYRAERVGGDPTDYHWETAASHLVPMADLDDALHHVNDKPILAKLKGESDVVIKLALGFADLVELLGDIVEKGKAWSSQPRVPAGFPTGGRWMKGGYGGGGWGGMYADQGVALALQKHGGTGPQSEALNAKVKMFEDAANQGYIHPAAQKLILKPKPQQTYSAAAWESANEAATYVHAMKGMGKKFAGASMGLASGTTKPAKATPDADLYTQPIGTFKDPMKLSDMTKVGSKPGGSAAGALYKDAAGDTWMVKSYDTAGMAFNEVAAAKLYGMMGVAVPEMKLIDLGEAHKGGIGVASKMMDLKPFEPFNASHIKAAQEDFAAHALMGNWDAVGLSFDNLMIDAVTGKTVMVDPGGSMLYRAQGGLKGDAFKDNVTELDTLRDATKNPTAAKVFGKMTQEQIVNSMQKALAGLGEDHSGTMGLKQDVASAIVNHWGGPLKNQQVADLIDKMDNRLLDMHVKAKAMTADFASTASLDIATTGTTKASLSHADPTVAMLANIHDAKNLDKIIQDQTINAMNFEAQMTGSSAKFYSQQLEKTSKAAFAGDTMKVAETFYIPTSTNAKLKENYALYKKSYNAITSVGQAQAALKLQDAAKAGDGGLVTGASKVTPADVTMGLKEAGMVAPGTNMLHPDWAAQGDPTNLGAQIAAANEAQGFKSDDDLLNLDDVDFDILDPVTPPSPTGTPIAAAAGVGVVPKVPAQPVLTVPPTMPVKPKVGSPTNPKPGLEATMSMIEKIATSGEPDAVVKIQAIAATIKAGPKGNYHDKQAIKAKTYAANVVAALGGQAAIDATPAAPKKKAQEAGLKIAADVVAKTPLSSSSEIVQGYTVKTETTEIPFDPSKLTPPPDFHNWHGTGKPLYNTQPQFNAINTATAQVMHGHAVKQEKTQLSAQDVSASKQLTSYKQVLLQELDAVGAVITKRSLIGKDGKPADASVVAKAIADAQVVPKQKGASATQKFEGHIIAGAADKALIQAVHDTMPQKVIHKDSTELAKFAAMTSAELAKGDNKAIVSSYTGSGYKWINPALRNPSSSKHEQAKMQAKALTDVSYELPAGLVLSRTVDHGTFDSWKSREGQTITEPGMISTSLRGSKPNETPVFAGNDHYMRIISGPNLKGLYVAKSSAVGSGEAEIMLNRNTRFMVARVYKSDGKPRPDDPFFSLVPKGKTIIEVVAMNQAHED